MRKLTRFEEFIRSKIFDLRNIFPAEKEVQVELLPINIHGQRRMTLDTYTAFNMFNIGDVALRSDIAKGRYQTEI